LLVSFLGLGHVRPYSSQYNIKDKLYCRLCPMPH
jgi:hypothetical protein